MKTSYNVPIFWRWRLLIAAAIILFVVAYRFNISKTISLVRSYNKMVNASDTIPENVEKMRYAHSELIDSNRLNGEDLLLRDISTYCDSNDILINEISQNYYFGKDSTKIEANRITVEGNYESILKFIYYVEQDKKIATVSSASIALFHDKTAGIYSLVATLYIKKILYAKI